MLCEFHVNKKKMQGGWEVSSLVGQRLLPRDNSTLLKGACVLGDQLSICVHLSSSFLQNTLISSPRGDNPKTSQDTVSSLKLRMSCPLLISDVASLALVTYKLEGQVIWIPHLRTQHPEVEQKQHDYNTNLCSERGRQADRAAAGPWQLWALAGQAPRRWDHGWRISLVRPHSNFWEELPGPLFFMALTPSSGRFCLDHYLLGHI